ncbi:MAG TPA: hypothetical protein VM222_04265 [Planctomycetota bacterium]|nr:hypothetical protein [Planctomycetota bacterium]
MLTLALLAGCLLQAQGVQERSTEVVFVGTQHFITDMPAGYGPGHLRALLDRIHPDVLAVEAPAAAKNPWDFAPYELQRVTKPWAEQHKIALVPVGWNDVFYQARIQTMIGALAKAGRGEDFQKLEARFQQELAGSVGCEAMNGEKGLDLWRQYHRALHDLLGKDTPWELWNAKILENLKTVLKEHRGKRIAIAFGAAHGYILLDGLAKEEGVKVLPCSSFFPLAPEEVDRNTSARDHLQALRPLNFGMVAPEQIDSLAGHLEQAREYSGDYDLFSGKLLLHRGRPEEAAAQFRKAAALGDERLSEFDGSTRLNEAGAIYEAIALARLAKVSDARDRIEALLRKETLSAPMRQWAAQVLQEVAPKK